MLIKTRISMSLDGYISTPAGWPVVDVGPSTEDDHGFTEYKAGCGAVVWGRTSFDQGFGGGWETWPWPDTPVYVLSSRPLPEQAGVFDGDAQVVGGGGAIRSLLGAGVLDRLEILIMPLLLGSGVPLFDQRPVPYTAEVWASAADRPPAESLAGSLTSLELLHHGHYADGFAELIYRRAEH
ncbi:dihydrofolate reductase family protein [Microlunatus sp. GCM10028923]|uniref:dihydrofolate reductase family protein n=1 Tax=Microlunatus sp. GCM10028923 TaxID=3273400 RepID=UPI00361CE2CE